MTDVSCVSQRQVITHFVVSDPVDKLLRVYKFECMQIHHHTEWKYSSLATTLTPGHKKISRWALSDWLKALNAEFWASR